MISQCYMFCYTFACGLQAIWVTLPTKGSVFLVVVVFGCFFFLFFCCFFFCFFLRTLK